ncbi:MAG: iron-containing alcohol dehydrogenase [Collinsella sp.]
MKVPMSRILETRVYGTNSTRANIAKVVNSPPARKPTCSSPAAAQGARHRQDRGHRAQEDRLYVPTICSNCSAATAIAVVYNDDGSLEGYSYPNRPAHIFINPKIIAEAPAEYFWAGVGDALSKQPEVEYATSAGNLEHTAGLGLALAHTCSEPLFTYGVQGLEDVRQNLSSEAVKQIALDIVVNTGYVSNLTNQNDYYYNSSVAHAFYNATCSIPREGTYLHGEVVSLGVLVLFAYTGDTENLKRYATFNKQMGLPVTLEQVGLPRPISRPCAVRHATNEWKQETRSPSPTKNSPPPSRPPTPTATPS